MASKVRHTGICYHGTQVAVSGINSCIIWDYLLNEFDPKSVDLDKCYPSAEEMEPKVREAFDWLDDTHSAADECRCRGKRSFSSRRPSVSTISGVQP